MTTRQQVPAIDGWFTLEADNPTLLGSRCTTCATIAFPPRSGFCPNPFCAGSQFEQVPLSRTGRIWSFTTNHYAPPEPYISPEPFVPYTVVAVELAHERMVVLGQLAPGVDPSTLEVGQDVELTLGTLFSDDEADHVMWQWRPCARAASAGNAPSRTA